MAKPERIRGRKLQAIIARVLRANPLCAECAKHGKVTLATQVDHIVPVFKGGDDSPYDDSNRQGLCDPCHEKKTADDLGYKLRPTIGADGWPVEDRR